MSRTSEKNWPRVTISAAITIDGFLDSVDQERLIISSDEDMEEVHRLRAESDAILVGAETIRRDDCSLTARGDFVADDQPLRVTVTKSGNLDPGRKFFSAEGGASLVFCPTAVEGELRERLGPDTEVLVLDSSSADAMKHAPSPQAVFL
ncbi:MAG: RibD family protein [Proteobacteria bacterium]|nr:RibD family protein [Pseudomonadota bacterium]